MKIRVSKLKRLIRESIIHEMKYIGSIDPKTLDVYRVVSLYPNKNYESETDLFSRYTYHQGFDTFVIVPYTRGTIGDYYYYADGTAKKRGDNEIADYVASSKESIVVNHNTKSISLDIQEFQHMSRRPNKNRTKSYMIPHGDVSFNSVVTLQKLLRDIMKLDNRISQDYVIVGNPSYDGMTISDILKLKRPGDQVVSGGNFKPMIFYHGTSKKRYDVIKKFGLRPGMATTKYFDLVDNHSEKNVYLTTSISIAENYATRAAVEDKSSAVILKVIVRDPTKFIFDEDILGGQEFKITDPNDPTNTRIRFNYTKWQNWPDEQKTKLLQIANTLIAKGLNKRSTIAYRGIIPARDISVYATYKPASMSDSPKAIEYDAAREKTLKTYVR